MSAQTYDVFISYKSEDLALAEDLNKRLTAQGFSVWFDKARLDPGCNWYEEIEEGCEASRIILPVLTPRWQHSIWTRFETYSGEEIIPLLFEGEHSEVAPCPIQYHQFFDLRRPSDEVWQDLLAKIRNHLETPRPDRGRRLHYVLHQRNPYFTGREDELLAMHERLWPPRHGGLSQGAPCYVYGGPGVGKTSLAREYAEHFWRLYQDIVWVQARGDEPAATTPPDLTGEFARLAVELGALKEPTADANTDARIAFNSLRDSEGPHRLLIIDNALNEDGVRDWIPPTGKCHTLVTSRFTGWFDRGQVVEVGKLEPPAARRFLLRRTEREEAEDEEGPAAERLAERVEYLPLLLEQAAAYCASTKTSFSQYLQLYEEEEAGKELRARRAPGATDYPRAAATTWRVTVRRLSALSKAILRLSAFLAPEAIPRSLLAESLDILPEASRGCHRRPDDGPRDTATPLAPHDALGELNDYSMISLTADDFSIHRVHQDVQRDELTDDEQRAWAERAVRAVNAAFPHPEFPNWPVCDRILPHALACDGHIRKCGLVTAKAGRVLTCAGYYLKDRGQYDAAEPLVRQAMEIGRQALGEEHRDYATSLNNLAALYQAMGRYEEAEPLCRQAMEIRRVAPGENHPDYATSLNNLAGLCDSMGRYEQAEPLYRQASEVWRKALGDEHPHYATSLNNVAGLYYALGRYEEAEPLYRQAMEIDRKALAEEHPGYATDLNNLAALCCATGRYEEAEPLLVQAMGIDRSALGEDHPSYATSLNNLAELYRAMGRYEEAEPLYQRAIEIRRQALGADHPDYAGSLNNLALLYRTMSRYEEAEPLYVQALAVWRKALGDDHPHTKMCAKNLEACRRPMGASGRGRPSDPA